VLQQHQQQQILQLVHKVQLLLFKNLQEGKKERKKERRAWHPPFGAFDFVAFVDKVVCVN
jgi:hypothetical protein